MTTCLQCAPSSCTCSSVSVVEIDVSDLESKPYKIICISMYTRDIEELDTKVAEMKRRGWTKLNKSQLIRIALRQLDLDVLNGLSAEDLK